jgi:hypothetical protein
MTLLCVRRLTAPEQEREFSPYAGKEKCRFFGAAEQADTVQRDPPQREIANIDGLLAETARHGERFSV